ncbi:c-type cytochrome [Dankookia sp. GCM10030260]|uniref:c-type cytochrome n=1 Tax=Dankookia sp. GCM10030260 TaxID=3273390 RepID=UPI003620396E
MRASLAAAFLAAAVALPAAAAGDPGRGEALARERQCGTCHGAAGVSSLPNIPSLAGHTDEFITLQLILMREGIRIAPPMNELAQGLTDGQVEDIAAYYLSLHPGPPAGGPDGDPAKLAEGATLSEALRCGVCHLPDYRGRAQMPRLAGQREDYLVHAMLGYRDGSRHGTDTSMNAVMYGVTDEQVALLAYYLARQK